MLLLHVIVYVVVYNPNYCNISLGRFRYLRDSKIRGVIFWNQMSIFFFMTVPIQENGLTE